MIERLILYFGVLLALIMSEPARAGQPDSIAARQSEAVELFLHGKVKQAVRAQQALIATAQTSSESDKALLQRDLVEMCATGQDWRCVAQALQDLLPIVQSDRRLASFRFDIAAYGAKLALWRQNNAEVEQFLRQGGALATPDPSANPAAVAELQFALHDYYVRNNDLRSAEKSLSAGILGLLLSDGYGSYRLAELSVGLLQSLLHAQDIVGAFALANKLIPVMPKLASGDSVPAARYLMLFAHLSAYTEKYAATAAAFMQASHAIEQLDIDEDSKIYDLSIANGLATVALILDGRAAEASELHAKHPLQQQKEAILKRGEFLTTQQLYFAVSDVFVSAVAKVRPDLRWKRLFEQGSRWKLDGVEAADLESYRNFALGILETNVGNMPEASRLLRLAARQRIDNFDAVLRANFEGFPLPSMMDWIIIGIGLSVANGSDERVDIDLMLRGSEVLGRNLRHALVDVAVLSGSQPDEGARRSAQSYLHLLRQKRDFELDRIDKLLARNGALESKGELIHEYSDAVTKLTNLKERLLGGRKLVPANGLPSLDDLQKNIPVGSAFVTYFGFLDGIGKLCIARDHAVHAVARLTPELKKHTRLIEFATTASYPPNPELDAQFPISSAVYLHQFYFGGLQSCLQPGTHVTMAVPRNFARSVPFGALLADIPPRAGSGYDLSKAHWLIRDLSFSSVVSARQYLATMPYLRRAPALRPYLGVGAPKLDRPHVAQLASRGAFRGSLPTPNGLADFSELPETADELRAVGSLFGASPPDIMTREGATEESFRRKPLGDYDVLHFATHGLIKQDVAGLTESALLLTPSGVGDKFDDGVLTASKISRLPLNARLVVLSACNTAKYDIAQASLGVQDLQAAFTVAGAPTLLASLWPVDSPTARELVVDFFKEWRSLQTAGAADALSRATRSFLNGADAAHQHPRFWAPFVVVGNGAVRGAPAGAK
jgi:CHAT domain-containing protein